MVYVIEVKNLNAKTWSIVTDVYYTTSGQANDALARYKRNATTREFRVTVLHPNNPT